MLALLTHLAAAVTVLVLGFLMSYVLVRGVPNLRPEMFALTYTSENQSMLPAIINTCTMTLFSLLVAVPFGIGSGHLSGGIRQKGRKNRFAGAGDDGDAFGHPFDRLRPVRHAVFLGQAAFWVLDALRRADAVDYDSAADYAHDGGGAALRAGYVPRGSFGLGAGRLRTVARIVLPTAIPGILSGVILAIGRIVGETAALMYTSGTVERIAGLTKSGSTLALHMYIQASEGLYTEQAYATSVVLLALVLLINLGSSRIAKMMMKGRE